VTNFSSRQQQIARIGKATQVLISLDGSPMSKQKPVEAIHYWYDCYARSKSNDHP